MVEKKFRNISVIKVSLNNDLVGRVAFGTDRRCLFEYDVAWLDHGFSISPFYLPLQPGLFTARHDPFNGLFGVFNDSLPDGWGTLLIDRWLQKKGILPAALTPLDRLALVGLNGMGALVYEPYQGPESQPDNTDLCFLAGEASKILHDEYCNNLELLIQKGESSGGARPKVLVHLDGEDWLVKFPASTDPAGIGELEYRYSLVARKCGIIIPLQHG